MKLNNLIWLLGCLSWIQGNCMEKPITNEYKLENGLKLIVREDHRSPVVVSQVWYKVGSANEYYPTGVSHALEHMMFQGTPTLPKDAFSQLISRYGGRDNAFTAQDFTAYYEELDAAHLAVSFEVEADRMTNLTLSPEAFTKEIQVVMEERRLRTEDNPQHLTWERFMAAANVAGPYHHPVIGWQSDLDQMTVNDLRRWYESWYAPNNATIVVVGDVKGEAVLELAQKYFGPLAAKPLSTLPLRKELVSLGVRRIQVAVPAELPYGIWGYDVPTLRTASQSEAEEIYALVVANALLSGGESARLPRELVREQRVAAAIEAYYEPFKQYNTQFVITAIPAEGQTIAVLEQKILDQIEQLKQQPISSEELQKVKTQVLAQEVFEKDSMSDQATLLGMLDAVGLPWQIAHEFPNKINAVTKEQVQQVMNKYFHPTRLTVAELIPQKI